MTHPEAAVEPIIILADGELQIAMNSRWHRTRAHLYYLRNPIIRFLPLLAGLAVLLVAGSISFKQLYQQDDFSYVESLYVTFCLVFMEHIVDFPEHWLLQAYFFALPPLGLVVILDGIVRFSYHVLRRDEAGEEWTRAMCKTMSNHIVLCGLGKLGLRTLEQLIYLNQPVAVLEKNPQCPNLAFARKNGVPVRLGHSREQGVFDDLNVAEARSIILATNDDLANLEMAIDARKLNPQIRVILRMFDQELAAKLRESFDMPLTFSTSELAAPLFATSSFDESIMNSFYVGDTLFVIANLVIQPTSELINTPIREIGKQSRVFVLRHVRDGQTTLFPSAETLFQEGDQIMIQAEPETLTRIHEQNHDPLHC